MTTIREQHGITYVIVPNTQGGWTVRLMREDYCCFAVRDQQVIRRDFRVVWSLDHFDVPAAEWQAALAIAADELEDVYGVRPDGNP